MRQVFQSLSTGEISLVETPVPSVGKGQILIKSNLSLVSSGTERFLVDFGKSNIIEKAIKQPNRVKEVMDKTITDGIVPTIRSVKSKFDEPLPLGYCNVGEIIAMGEGIKGFEIGQRVVSNGYHAEYVLVSENLCQQIPDEIDDKTAVFTILGSIGLQGIRLLKPTLGETFLVSGLGLIGILAAQLLKFNGCKVLGLDPEKKKCELAESFGIKSFQLKDGSDPIDWCLNNTNNIGVDGVLIAASTKSSEPIDLAAKVSRVRGRIVLVGVTGIEIKRDLFYKKELSFQVSCSYGPGRYDPNYEKLCQDYPIGFVRWTEKRNFEAVLDAFSSKKVSVENLITKYFSLDDAAKAYELLLNDYSSLGIVLTYPRNNKLIKKIEISNERSDRNFTVNKHPIVNFIGSGNYARKILIPSFSKAGAEFNIISSKNGVGPVFVGKKFNFKIATTNINDIFDDKESNSIVIASRHDSHAKYLLEGLKSGKNVFVEKPICLNLSELEEIKKYLLDKNDYKKPLLMVGYNRRFAPLILNLKNMLNKINTSKAYIYTCNAGYIDEKHWTQDPNIGGGRLIGEACHFVDLLRFLEQSPIKKLAITSVPQVKISSDTFSLQIEFESGSIGTVHYFSNGNKRYPKERIEVFGGQKIMVLDNFRSLKAWGVKGFKIKRNFYQDKGQLNCVRAFIKAIQSDNSQLIPYSEIIEVQKFLLEAIKK